MGYGVSFGRLLSHPMVCNRDWILVALILPGQSASRIQEHQRTTNQRPRHNANPSISGTKKTRSRYTRGARIIMTILGNLSTGVFETRKATGRRIELLLLCSDLNQSGGKLSLS